MHHMYRHTFIVKVKTMSKRTKTNPERAVTSEEEEKKMSEGREKRAFGCLYNI